MNLPSIIKAVRGFIGIKDGSGNIVATVDVSGTRRLAIDVTGVVNSGKVEVSSNDTTAAFLKDKIVSTEGVQQTELNNGGDEDLQLKMDINGLATDATPDRDADFVATFDVSGGLHKKVLTSVFQEAMPFLNTLKTLIPKDRDLPSTNAPSDGVRNNRPMIEFDDVTDEFALFAAVIDFRYKGGGITFDIDWVAASATSGDVKWRISVERMEIDVFDVDTNSFGTAISAVSTTNGTNGVLNRTIITLTNPEADSPVAGDPIRLKIERMATDVADTMVGDAQLFRVTVRQT